jgi:plastocyanin
VIAFEPMRRAPSLTSVLVLGLLAAAVFVPVAIAAVVNVSMQDNSFVPQNARPALGDTVTWTNNGFNPHTSTSTNTSVKNPNGTPGVNLWRSPVLNSGGQFSRVFRFSGRFPYYCEIHQAVMKGTVVVPIKVAKAAVTGGTRITVTWATVIPPSGLVFDVQRKLPGSSAFQNWQVGVTTKSASFVTSNPGTYSFRSRVRRPSTGGVSFYSDPKPITVP